MKKAGFLITCLFSMNVFCVAQMKQYAPPPPPPQPQQQPPQGPPQPPAKLPPFTKKGAPIPPFKLYKVDGKIISNADLKPNKPVMVMIFSPECDHCEHMVDSMKQIADKFKNTQLLLVAEDRNKQLMGGFINKTGIGSHPLFQKIGTNKGELIFSIYTYKILPQINFYNSKHLLEKTFDGNYSFDSVKMFIH